MKQAIVSACLVASYGAFGVGCSAETTDAGGSENAKASNAAGEESNRIPASADTKEAYGIDAWVVETGDGTEVVQGFDEDGALRVRFAQTLTTNAAGDLHGEITANIDGEPRFEYDVTADGTGTVTRNDFPSHQRAVDAALAALADFQRGGENLATSDSLTTQDLSRGDPKLVSGSHCIAAIGATMCILASMCGLGGDAGANVLAATVEAGVSQECH